MLVAQTNKFYLKQVKSKLISKLKTIKEIEKYNFLRSLRK